MPNLLILLDFIILFTFLHYTKHYLNKVAFLSKSYYLTKYDGLNVTGAGVTHFNSSCGLHVGIVVGKWSLVIC
jgi:hypothetical protein